MKRCTTKLTSHLKRLRQPGKWQLQGMDSYRARRRQRVLQAENCGLGQQRQPGGSENYWGNDAGCTWASLHPWPVSNYGDHCKVELLILLLTLSLFSNLKVSKNKNYTIPLEDTYVKIPLPYPLKFCCRMMQTRPVLDESVGNAETHTVRCKPSSRLVSFVKPNICSVCFAFVYALVTCSQRCCLESEIIKKNLCNEIKRKNKIKVKLKYEKWNKKDL